MSSGIALNVPMLTYLKAAFSPASPTKGPVLSWLGVAQVLRVKMNGIVSLPPCTPLDPSSTHLCSDLPCSVSPGGFTMHSIPWAPHPLPSCWVLPVLWQEIRRPEGCEARVLIPLTSPMSGLDLGSAVHLYAGPQLLSAQTPPSSWHSFCSQLWKKPPPLAN